ncbi:MAG TPA: dienelactone hydrolase family protein [Bryobacterales bacterium]|jgi:putative phosphoribosyl transferase|nr:dienelactone hydrolase family protein [Bryobacterales bacterium]
MPAIEQPVSIPIGSIALSGDLAIPDNARGIVIFAHGSGSGRHSPRNRFVAQVLQQSGLATLLMDLLTPQEEIFDSATGELRFNIQLLAARLAAATEWLAGRSATRSLEPGYFGASTGAAAALAAAARLPGRIGAIVSRGGRPDLAGSALRQVRAPTLLIVGGNDRAVIALNEAARDQLLTESRMEIIPGAGHLFEEPGALEQVAFLARNWFDEHLGLNRAQEEAAV